MLRFRHRPFLQLYIGVNVHLGTFDGLMTEPECDYGSVDAVLEQLHRGAVA
jgi:hypothetical protein